MNKYNYIKLNSYYYAHIESTSTTKAGSVLYYTSLITRCICFLLLMKWITYDISLYAKYGSSFGWFLTRVITIVFINLLLGLEYAKLISIIAQVVLGVFFNSRIHEIKIYNVSRHPILYRRKIKNIHYLIILLSFVIALISPNRLIAIILALILSLLIIFPRYFRYLIANTI